MAAYFCLDGNVEWDGRAIEHAKLHLESFNMEICADAEMALPSLKSINEPGLDSIRLSASVPIHFVCLIVVCRVKLYDTVCLFPKCLPQICAAFSGCNSHSYLALKSGLWNAAPGECLPLQMYVEACAFTQPIYRGSF